MAIADQKITKSFALYQGDCCEVIPSLPDDSVGFSIFSPPFCNLYSYSDDRRDMGNSRSYAEFFKHFDFLIAELARVMMPGRNVAVHCMDLPMKKSHDGEIGLRDFPGAIIAAFERKGFIFHSRHCIWKDPLLAAVRTKALTLAHKQIVKDSAMCAMGIPDYIVTFRKRGENPKPVAHPGGLTKYYGGMRMPMELEGFVGHENQATNKRSHWIWQRYASPVWDDIRQTNVLPYSDARESDDQRHICPLQIDVIERCLALWAAKGDTVLTPFMGVGSEVYCAVRNGCCAVGIELKASYFRQALRNLQSLGNGKKQFS